MMKTEKAPASAATLTGAAENRTASQTAHASAHDSIILAADSQIFRVADLLLVGEENALPMKHLRSVTGRSSRELRAMIQQERLEGAAICSNNQTGYYIAADDQERERFVKSMRHRSAVIARVADAVEQAEV